MWRFDADAHRDRHASACSATAAPATSPARGCCARQFPAYFAAIEPERVIAAHDARTDPRTRGFPDVYLEPQNIGAMLDVPLRQGAAVSGVLCVEHVGGAADVDRSTSRTSRSRPPT